MREEGGARVSQSQGLLRGTPWKAIVLFSVPLLIGNVVQQLYQFVDAMVVGRYLGVLSLASVGASMSLLFLITGFAWGMTSGFAIPVAQAFGANDVKGVRRSVAAGAILSALSSLVMTLVGTIFIRPLLQLMQTPHELLDNAVTFGFWSFLFMFTLVFFDFLAAVIRAVGDSRTPLVFLAISCLLNVALVILFVAVFNWGIAGAAISTAVSQLTSVLACVAWVRSRIPVLHLTRDDWKVTLPELREHLYLGLPLGFQTSVIAIGTIAVQVRLNELGPDSVAAFTAAGRVDGIAITFLASLGLATSTFVAQNYGARQIDRVKQGVRQALVVSVLVSVAIGLALFFLGSVFVEMFIGDSEPDVLNLAHHALKIYSVAYWTLGILFVVRGSLQGLGHMKPPFYSGIAELVMRVFTAVVLGAAFGFIGVAWGGPLAWIGSIALLIPSYIVVSRKLNARTYRQGPRTEEIEVLSAPFLAEKGVVADPTILQGESFEDVRTGAIPIVRDRGETGQFPALDEADLFEEDEDPSENPEGERR